MGFKIILFTFVHLLQGIKIEIFQLHLHFSNTNLNGEKCLLIAR